MRKVRDLKAELTAEQEARQEADQRFATAAEEVGLARATVHTLTMSLGEARDALQAAEASVTGEATRADNAERQRDELSRHVSHLEREAVVNADETEKLNDDLAGVQAERDLLERKVNEGLLDEMSAIKSMLQSLLDKSR